MTDPKLPPDLMADIDAMRDVYMSSAQRGAYERILARAATYHARAAVELAGGGRDGERLDWLDKVSAGTIRMDRYDLPGDHSVLGVCPTYTRWGPTDHYTHKTARAAIDAAMTGGEHG
jgi:hypothetical protein